MKQLILIFLFLLVWPQAQAAKMDLYFGAFDFSAETSSSSGSKSGVGAYKISYFLPIFDQVEVGLGYTLILSSTFSGDAAFGLDIEAAYFPLSSVNDLKIQTDKTSALITTVWKPFLLFGYNARQFQSVSTQYNGASLGVGFERALEAKYKFKGLVRFADMAGANEGSATEISILGGLSFGF